MCICMCVVFVCSGLKRVLRARGEMVKKREADWAMGGMLRLWFPADGGHTRTSQRPVTSREERSGKVTQLPPTGMNGYIRILL